MARLFDEVNDEYLRHDGAPVTSPPFSFCLWFYCNTRNYRQAGICDASASNEWYFQVNNWGIYALRFSAYDGSSGHADTTAGISLGTWHHAAGVAIATDSRAVYLDGGGKGTNTDNISPTAIDTTVIGASYRASTLTAPFDGRIAEPAIWNTDLSDAEVAALAAGAHPYTIRPQNLVAYWPLLRTDQDLVGGYDMTPYNSPTWADHPSGLAYPVPQSFALAAYSNVWYRRVRGVLL